MVSAMRFVSLMWSFMVHGQQERGVDVPVWRNLLRLTCLRSSQCRADWLSTLNEPLQLLCE